MEELRTMDSPGMKDAGRLYRVACEKKGIFAKGGVPIEYARLQTETPGREAWDHSWTR
jgi:large subunit ribosomal protein L40